MDKVGATGRYPQGKLDESDEGELTLAVTRTGDVIRIDFGKSIEWIAMSPEDAAGFAQLLMQHAERRR